MLRLAEWVVRHVPTCPALRHHPHSSPSFDKGCPKRRRDALSRAGFMLERCLIFPGDPSLTPGNPHFRTIQVRLRTTGRRMEILHAAKLPPRVQGAAVAGGTRLFSALSAPVS